MSEEATLFPLVLSEEATLFPRVLSEKAALFPRVLSHTDKQSASNFLLTRERGRKHESKVSTIASKTDRE